VRYTLDCFDHLEITELETLQAKSYDDRPYDLMNGSLLLSVVQDSTYLNVLRGSFEFSAMSNFCIALVSVYKIVMLKTGKSWKRFMVEKDFLSLTIYMCVGF